MASPLDLMTWPPGVPTSVRKTIPSYPYVQYQDDDYVTAFFEAYNAYAQGYVDWFNSLNLPIYTRAPVEGALLDWVATGLYGIGRPALSASIGEPGDGPVNTLTANSLTVNGYRPGIADTHVSTTDDTFRRVITWAFYKGDGKVTNPRWLKRRINRFLNGMDGTDVPNDTTYDISVAPTGVRAWTITIPDSTAARIFAIAVSVGVLELPLQIEWTVTIV